MSLNDDDIKQIFKFMDASDFEELNLKIGDLHLIVSKRKQDGSAARSFIASETQTQPSQPPLTATSVAIAAEAVDSQQPVEAKGPEPVADGLISITAPTLGVFYRSAKPDAPAFVQEGDLVEETDTVCIIEVMKLFNHIKADVRGRVVKICADDGAMVEHGQLLFLIEPESN